MSVCLSVSFALGMDNHKNMSQNARNITQLFSLKFISSLLLGSEVKCVCMIAAVANFKIDDSLRAGCHILVATPGRLWDFLTHKRLSLEDVRYLIIDEVASVVL